MDMAVACSVIICLYYAIFKGPQSQVFDISIQLLFVIEFISNFLTEYVDEFGNRVSGLKEISIHYVKTWCVIDFIAIMPWRFVGFSD